MLQPETAAMVADSFRLFTCIHVATKGEKPTHQPMSTFNLFFPLSATIHVVARISDLRM